MIQTDILIVEDRILLAADLEDRIKAMALGNIIGMYASGERALEATHETPPDIALLDISLKGQMDGIELAEQLVEKHNTAIIFLTHLEDERILNRATAINPVAFLNKPYTNGELKMALYGAISSMSEPSTKEKALNKKPFEPINDRIFVKNGRGKFSILLDHIIWIQSGGGDKASIYSIDPANQKKRTTAIGFSLSKLEEKLAFCPHLIRCSRYYIVNLKMIERIIEADSDHKAGRRKSLMIAEKEINIGDKYRKELMSRLHVI
jgi:DNA-binding LytR/AlgR family response regulator